MQCTEGLLAELEAAEEANKPRAGAPPPPPPVDRVRPGVFVSDRDRGYGKVTAVTADGKATVEFFSSPSVQGRETVFLQASAIEPVHPLERSRCFVENQGSWWIGRVIAPVTADQADIKYEVQQEGQGPGEKNKTVSAKNLYVRCRTELPDPVDVIKYGALHSPQSALHRSEFIRDLLEQRRLSHGFTALTSSNIELHRHQVEIAQRVLSDPIQRYLLADEVGLGKTIEAGIVIRQYLIDEAKLDVVVCVPRLLVAQWERELREKFSLADWPGRWSVIPHESLNPDDLAERVGLLVIDEVHNIFRGTETAEAIAQRTAVQRAAHQVPRLLLLSATPLLHNEAVFLGMLNLIDPALYRLDELDRFRERVESKQVLAEQLQSFTDDAGLWLLEELADTFRETFENDTVLSEKLDELLALCEEADPDEDTIRSLVKPIRVHIGETYRLHRRVLRTRRHSPLAANFPVRGRKLARSIPRVSEVESDSLTEVLDEWCRSWLTKFSRRARDERISADEVVAVCGLLDRLQTLPSILRAYCRVWRGATDRAAAEAAELSDIERGALTNVALTADELVLLAELETQLDEPDSDQMWGRRCLGEIKKIPHGSLVFCGFNRAAELLAFALNADRPVSRLLNHDGSAEDALRWLQHDGGSYLLCGRNAEEGYNAQFAKAMLHLHVPLNPSRLEQRIGRVDRFGAGEPVEILLPERMSYWATMWATYLDQATGVFDESIASLQHVIESEVARILTRFMTHGTSEQSWSEVALEQREALDREKKKILQLEALESIEAESDERSELFNDLVVAGERASAFRDSVLDWLGRSGHLNSIGLIVTEHGGIRLPSPAVAMGVHRSIVIEELGLSRTDVDREVTARVGAPFIRELGALTTADDLGQTFGFVRDTTIDEPLLLAQVTMRVDGATRRIRETLQRHVQEIGEGVAWESVARLVDGLVPPQHLVLHFDTERRALAPELEILAVAPFDADSDNPLGLAQVQRIMKGYGVDWTTWWAECRETALEEARSSLDLEKVKTRALALVDEGEEKLKQQIALRRRSETDKRVVEALEQDLVRQLAIGGVVRQAIDLVEPVVEAVGAVLLRPADVVGH